jgi:microcystin-dependent protein
MKKFNFPGGGQRVNLTDIKDLHDEHNSVLEALLWGVGGCVLRGIVISGTQTNASISEGWCFLDGEYLYLPAQTGVNFSANPTQYLQKGAPVQGRPKNFVTGGLKNTRITTNAERVTVLPSSGEYIKLTFTGHNQSFAEVLGRKLIPIGTIQMAKSLNDFNTTSGLGSGPWKGWALCDGQNGTLDLRGRFPVGYHSTDVDYNLLGKIGGAKSVTLTEAHIPNHTHRLPQYVDNKGNNFVFGNGTANLRIVNDDVNQTASAGGGQAHENRPPFTTVAFVEKIA